MAISLGFLACSFVLVFTLLSAAPHQVPLTDGQDNRKLDLIHELEKAEIIPTVIDTFNPLLTLTLSWKNASADYGNTINPSLMQKAPKIKFLDQIPSTMSERYGNDLPQLTLAMTDPDAPSRGNPKWSEFCHWIVTGVPLVQQESGNNTNDPNIYEKDLKEVVSYRPPGPPPKTGKHRYVFVALSPRNGTSKPLHLRAPDDRRRWGYEKERQGLRKWMDEMELDVFGANFIYAQNDEQ